jgi:hypothetical protein
MIGSDGPGDKLFRLVAPRSMVGSAPIPRSSMNGSSLGPRGVGGGYNPQAQISYSAGAISDRRPVVDASRFLPYGMNSAAGIGGGGAILKSNSSEERYLASRNGEAYGINGGGAILKSGSSEERYLASRNSEDVRLVLCFFANAYSNTLYDSNTSTSCVNSSSHAEEVVVLVATGLVSWELDTRQCKPMLMEDCLYLGSVEMGETID